MSIRFSLITITLAFVALNLHASASTESLADQQIRVFRESIKVFPDLSYPQILNINASRTVALQFVTVAGTSSNCSGIPIEHKGRPVILTALHCVGNKEDRDLNNNKVGLTTALGRNFIAVVGKVFTFTEIDELHDDNKFLLYPMFDIAIIAGLVKTDGTPWTLEEIPTVPIAEASPPTGEEIFHFGRPGLGLPAGVAAFVQRSAYFYSGKMVTTRGQVISGDAYLNSRVANWQMPADEKAAYLNNFKQFSFFTNGAVLPGMSGGPVFNSQGEVAGITTMTNPLPTPTANFPYDITTHIVNLTTIHALLETDR